MGIPEEPSYQGGDSASPYPMGCISLENPFFYTLPTSPPSSKPIPNVSLVSETEPATPFTLDDEDPTSSELDYFVFDITSGHFDLNTFETETSRTQSPSHDKKQVQIIQRAHSMPRSPRSTTSTMAFADGQVMPSLTVTDTPPLKLPPRLQHGHHLKLPSKSPKLKTSRHIFKNEYLDDPFLIAMQNVTSESSTDKDRDIIINESKFRTLRRAWSFSSSWASGPNNSTGLSKMGHSEFDQPVGSSTAMSLFDILGLDHKNGTDRPLRKYGPRFGNPTKYVGSSSKRLGWPKELRKRMGPKTGPNEPSGPDFISENGPTRDIGIEGTERRACLSESKRDRIKKFLLGDASMAMRKQKDSIAALWKPSLLRKISLKPVRSVRVRGNKVKSMYRMVRMTAVHYRPRLSFCWGGTVKR